MQYNIFYIIIILLKNNLHKTHINFSSVLNIKKIENLVIMYISAETRTNVFICINLVQILCLEGSNNVGTRGRNSFSFPLSYSLLSTLIFSVNKIRRVSWCQYLIRLQPFKLIKNKMNKQHFFLNTIV